jgi:hypothetical protein
MPYIGGTPEVQNFIKKFKASGYLIDPYSDEWVTNAHIRSLNGEINFEYDIESYKEFDQDYGTDYRNHLLIINTSSHNSELINDLKKIYQPLEYIFSETGTGFGIHKPDFLLINLATRQIMCVGLGRKNRLMQYDADKYANGISEPEIDFLADQNTANIDVAYVNRFKDLDHAGLIDSLIFNLKTLGESLVEYDYLNYHPEMYCELNDEGMYEFENGRDPVDEDELEALNESHYIINTALEESIEGICVFFPGVEGADLNNMD